MSTWVLKKDRKSWSTANGWQQVLSYEGLTSELSSFLSGEATAGYTAYEVTDNHGDDNLFSTVELTYALIGIASPSGGGTAVGNGLVSRTWSRDVSDVQRRIEEHPNVMALWEHDWTWPRRIKSAVDAYKAMLDEYFKGNQTTAPAEPTLPNPLTGASSTLRGYAQSYMDRIMLQDDPIYEDDETVLNKTEVVTLASTLKASSTNVKRVHTYAALVRGEPTLPAAALIDAAGLSTLKWFKKSPRVSQTNGGLFQIEQQYVGVVLHDEFYYGALIS